MGIFTIILTIAGIVTSALQSTGTISPGIASLITAIEGAIADFKAAITGSNGQISATAVSILQGIAAAITVLQAQPELPAATLALVQALDAAVQAGLGAFEAASLKLDATTLQPITPVS